MIPRCRTRTSSVSSLPAIPGPHRRISSVRCKEPRLQADLAEADTLAVRAVESFIMFLREDLLPRSTGAYALGRETYQRKLAYDELELTPVDTLLAEGRRALVFSQFVQLFTLWREDLDRE